MITALVTAFISPIAYALSGTMDAYMAKGEKGSPYSFAFYLYIAFFLLSFLIFFVATPGVPSFTALLFLIPIAICELAYLGPYYIALKHADASVVASLFSLNRILIPVFAYLLFNEVLQPIQYIGFIIVILSCSLLSLNFKSKHHIFNKKVFSLMLLASFILSAQSFLYRYAFEYTDWATAYFSVACLSFSFCFLFLFMPRIRRDIFKQYRYVKTIVPIIILEELCSVIGSSTEVFSLNNLPITIVKTIQSTYPLFVLIFAFIAVSRWKKVLKESRNHRTEIIRIGLIGMLIVGVYLVISMEIS